MLAPRKGCKESKGGKYEGKGKGGKEGKNNNGNKGGKVKAETTRNERTTRTHMLSRILGKTHGKTRGQTGTTRKLEKGNISWSMGPRRRERLRTSVDQSGGRPGRRGNGLAGERELWHRA